LVWIGRPLPEGHRGVGAAQVGVAGNAGNVAGDDGQHWLTLAGRRCGLVVRPVADPGVAIVMTVSLPWQPGTMYTPFNAGAPSAPEIVTRDGHVLPFSGAGPAS